MVEDPTTAPPDTLSTPVVEAAVRVETSCVCEDAAAPTVLNEMVTGAFPLNVDPDGSPDPLLLTVRDESNVHVESPFKTRAEFAVPEPRRPAANVPDVILAASLGLKPFKEVTPLKVPDPTVMLFNEVTPERVVTLGWIPVCRVPVKLVAVTPVEDTEDNPLNVPEPTVMPFKEVTPEREVTLG